MDATSMTGTETIHPNSDVKVTPILTLSEPEKNYQLFKRRRMIASRDVRDMKHPEFDDMTFLQWHDKMKKGDDQYVAPRKNKQDTSINLGTIRDKDSSLLEYAMKYDFEPVAQVFDDSDEMLVELAETGEDMVKKSKQIEDYVPKSKLARRSMIAFGTALVEDYWIERWIIEKTMKSGFKAGMGSDQITWTEKLVKQYDGCQSKLWDLRKCYFGDIRKFFMNGPQGQPYFFTVEYESYDTTKQFFGNWDRWQYVPTTLVVTPEMTSAQTWSPWWTLRPVTNNYCEIVKYYDPIANEFSISINGIEMLPIMTKKTQQDGIEKILVSGYPLTEVSPSGAIPFAKFDLEPMHDFVYSKGQPAKMRVLADVENMLMKLNLRMIKQKADPTMGNKSGRTFGEEVTTPATVINDIRESDLFPILPNWQGPSVADFSFFELVKKQLDQNSVERSFQGMDNSDSRKNPADNTATKEMNDLNAQSLKVAALFDGIIFGENQLNWLRTYNIAKNWTKPIDVHIDTFNKTITNKYRTITIGTEVEGGQKATKKIIFTKDTPKGKPTLKDSQALHQQELDHTKEKGGELRITHIHPGLLSSMKLMWSYTCVPVPNGSDPLSYMLFSKQIQDAQLIFGPDSLNVKKLKHKFASITGNDFDTWFLNEQELQQNRQQAAQAAQEAAGGAPGQIPGKQVAGQPTQAGVAQGTLPGARMSAMMK